MLYNYDRDTTDVSGAAFVVAAVLAQPAALVKNKQALAAFLGLGGEGVGEQVAGAEEAA